jgi:tRNA threonylcarbamoyladenosine biosynthesis protein TsaE
MGAERLLCGVLAGPEATEAFGEALGQRLPAKTLLALNGELGSGKTTLVRGLARGLEVVAGVVSPTFARMRILPGRLTLYHFDAWRGGAEDLFLEGQEFLSGAGVAVVEWAERVAATLPLPRLELTLTHRSPQERGLEGWLRYVPQEAENLQRALRAALLEAGRACGIQAREPQG